MKGDPSMLVKRADVGGQVSERFNAPQPVSQLRVRQEAEVS
ncbi:hypothetical protein [Phenylobacterium sp.]|nr:hypothetical protein [Phenylobacterium sp.]